MTVIAGRPLTIGEEVAQVDAVLYAWQPGTMAGPALADLLLGVASPSGKLPVSFPKVVGQIPLYYSHTNTGRPCPDDYQPRRLEEAGVPMPEQSRYASHYVDSDPFPLFLFGFGLTYTDFEYYDLEIPRALLASDQSLVVKARVANVGSRAAVETVQLYVRDLVASTVRPVKELKDFRRIALEPGESKVVEFALPYEALGFFDEREEYVIEAGEFEVSVGGSSATSLTASFTID